jgi:hypothetical protein
MCMWQFIVDTPSNFLKDSNASSKAKITKNREGLHFLVSNISGVRGGSWSSEMGTRMNNKQVNY